MSSREKPQTLLFDASALIDFIKKTLGYRSMTVSFGVVNYHEVISSVVGTVLGCDDMRYALNHLRDSDVSLADIETIVGRIAVHTTIIILPKVEEVMDGNYHLSVRTSTDTIAVTLTQQDVHNDNVDRAGRNDF